MRAWIKQHPKLSAALGAAAVAAATYYGGPAAGEQAKALLPKLVEILAPMFLGG